MLKRNYGGCGENCIDSLSLSLSLSLSPKDIRFAFIVAAWFEFRQINCHTFLCCDKQQNTRHFFWRFQFQCEAQALALSTSVVKIMRLQVNADSPNNMVTPRGLRDGEALSLRHQIFVTWHQLCEASYFFPFIP